MKAQLRAWLARAEFRKIVDAALERDRTVRTLITLTYDPDPLIHWRAVDAIGRCAERLAAVRPESMKNILRRLFWMMSDESGSVAWRAPEIVGEIIRSDPREFADFIPLTISLLDLEPEDRPGFLPGIMYALGRIGKAAPGSVDAGLPGILDALTDADPQVRAMAVCCLRRIGRPDLLLHYHELSGDRGKALVYCNENLLETTVGGLSDPQISILGGDAISTPPAS